MDLTTLSRLAFESAIRRHKTQVGLTAKQTAKGIMAEVEELAQARKRKSSHIPQYTEEEEELADILICCLTELYSRGCNAHEIVEAKIEFNKTRP